MRARWLALFACLPVVAVACAASSGPPIGGGPFDARAPDEEPETSPGLAEAGPTATPCVPKPDVAKRPAVVLVNASTRFGAFRLCPAQDDGSSGSFDAPTPTTIMPRSNLAGVDVASAVRVAPTSAFTGSHVLVLRIAEAAKLNPNIGTASCRDLACGTTTGGSCLPAGEVLRVPVVRADGGTASALADAGTLVVFRDDDGGPRVEIEPQRAVPVGCVGDLDYGFRDFTADGTRADYLDADDRSANRTSTAFRLPVDYTQGSLAVGAHRETLEAIHQHSAPSVPIDEFYRAPGPFFLFLLGPESGRHFVAMPVNGLSDTSTDAGRD